MKTLNANIYTANNGLKIFYHMTTQLINKLLDKSNEKSKGEIMISESDSHLSGNFPLIQKAIHIFQKV